jgi:NitT/TauT family transport system permease protein/sulfonate transport system permease protein
LPTEKLVDSKLEPLETGRPASTDGVGAAVAGRGRRTAASAWLGARRFTAIVAGALAWELAVRVGWIDGRLFPPPSAIAKAIVVMAQLGLLWADISASVLRVTVGFLIASVVAIALAVLLARWRGLAFYLMPAVDMIRPISVIAWIPIAILWFGLGNRPAWFIIFLGSFFPIFTNTYLGVRSVEPVHINAARCLGAGRVLFLREVLLPSALPYILTGMRVGLGVGWMCVIAAELIAAQSGLGYMIQLARVMLETEKVIAGMIVIGVIGYVMNQSMVWLEHRLTPWREGR